MKNMLLATLLIIILQGCASGYRHSTYLENDALALGGPGDANYTNGIQVNYEPIRSMGECLGTSSIDCDSNDNIILKPLIDKLNFMRPDETTLEYNAGNSILNENRVNYAWSQIIYTPDDLSISELQINDRPYAGYLFGSIQVSNIEITPGKENNDDDHNITRSTVGLDIGIVGKASGAEALQTWYHDGPCDCTHPSGWDNQLNTELGFTISVNQQKRLFRESFSNTFKIDLIGNLKGSFGNVYTGVEVGGNLRFGHNLPRSWSSGAITPLGRWDSDGNKGFTVFGFIRATGKQVLRDIFLDGNTFSNSHRVDRKNFFAEYSMGIEALWGNWGISATTYKRTLQFETQENPHRFGSIVITYILDH